MQNQTKPKPSGAPMAKLFLTAAIIVFLGVLFGAVGYLAKNKPIINSQPQVSPMNSQIMDSFTGTLISGGVECRLFQADNGTIYSLQGAGRITESFNDGDAVIIKGEFVERSYCMQGKKTIKLLEIDYVNNETADWQTYTNVEYGFEIKYPSELKGSGSNGEFIGSYGQSSVNLSIKVISVGDFSLLHPDFFKIMSYRTRIIDGINIKEYYNKDNRFIYFPLQRSPNHQIEIFAEVGFDNADENLDKIIQSFSFFEIPTDLKDIIFDIAKKDYAGLDSCGKKEITINDYQYNFKETDLNSDKTNEFIIVPIGFCNSTDFIGAQGNGQNYIFEKINGVWKNIGNIEGNGYQILERKTDGYFDIVATWHLGADALGLVYYKWQKLEMLYKEISTKDIEIPADFDIDKEISSFIEAQNN